MASQPARITIGELEAKYPLYCAVLQRLVSLGKAPEEIERTLCWERLSLLNRSLPNRYKAPDLLLTKLKHQAQVSG